MTHKNKNKKRTFAVIEARVRQSTSASAREEHAPHLPQWSGSHPSPSGSEPLRVDAGPVGSAAGRAQT